MKPLHLGVTQPNQTLEFYDQNAEAYAERAPHGRDVDALKRFVARMPKGGKVCDLGCGNGWASAHMLDRGLDVTAIDGSAGLAAEAYRRFSLQVEVSRFEDFHEPNCYDGIWACWSLHHASRTVFPQLLQRISSSIRPGGYLFFSVKGGTGEKCDELNRHYARYEPRELSLLIEELEVGKLIEHDSWSAACYSGKTEQMHHLLLRL